MGMALIDTGCASTVCGKLWFDCYLESLSCSDLRSVKYSKSDTKFKFGDGDVVQSYRQAALPIYLNTTKAVIDVDIIEKDIPLLLSKQSLKRGGAVLDFTKDYIIMLGERMDFVCTSSNHICIDLRKSFDVGVENAIAFQCNLLENDDLVKHAVKWHKQFAHPTAQRLNDLIRSSNLFENAKSDIYKVVNDVTDSCDVCKKLKKPPLTPAVAFPLASTFNEVVAMDIKDYKGTLILHLIDHATRYSSCRVIPNKRKETIVEAISEYWIRLFSSPSYFLTDNGGEFVDSI